MIARGLFRIARRRLAGVVVRFAFGRLAFLLPVRRVYESASVVAFQHPRPSWPTHVLLVPKRAVGGLLGLDRGGLRIVVEVLSAARAAEAALGLTGEERVLLVNGGAYQDVGQLHFHLAVGAEGFRFSSSGEAGSVELLEGGRVEAFARPKAGWAAHLVVRATEPGATLGDAATAMALFGAAQRLARERGLERDGFAVVQTRSPAGDEAALPARRLGRRAAIT